MITLASMADIKEIVDLFQAAKVEMLKTHIRQWNQSYPNYELIKQDIADNRCYKLVVKGRIVCVATFIERGDRCWLKRLATVSDCTKCGYASQIYHYLEGLAIAKKIGYSYSATHHSNHKMQEFFLKHGFIKGEGYIEKARSDYGLFYVFYKKLEVETDE